MDITIGTPEGYIPNEQILKWAQENAKHSGSKIVKYCHLKGILVNAWVINSVKDAIKMLKMNVDMISTDFPNIMCKFRKILSQKIADVLENVDEVFLP